MTLTLTANQTSAYVAQSVSFTTNCAEEGASVGLSYALGGVHYQTARLARVGV